MPTASDIADQLESVKSNLRKLRRKIEGGEVDTAASRIKKMERELEETAAHVRRFKYQ